MDLFLSREYTCPLEAIFLSICAINTWLPHESWRVDRGQGHCTAISIEMIESSGNVPVRYSTVSSPNIKGNHQLSL